MLHVFVSMSYVFLSPFVCFVSAFAYVCIHVVCVYNLTQRNITEIQIQTFLNEIT